MEHLTHINLQTKQAFILDSDGSIIEEGKFITEKEIQNSQKQRDAYRQKINRSINLIEGKLEHHVGCFQNQMKNIIPQLSLTDCGLIISLLAKMKIKADGLLVSNNRPMTLTDIQKYLGKSRSQTSVQLKKFTQLGVLIEKRNGPKKHYQVNPDLHIMGYHQKKHEKVWFIRLYKGKLKEMLNELSLRAIGFIYKSLPICHYNMFYLVHNPNDSYNPIGGQSEDNESHFENKLEFYNRKELAEYMNENIDNVTDIVKSLQEKGLIMKSSSSRTVSYRLHPHIVYPKGTISDSRIKYICDEFDAHKQAALRRKKLDVR